MELKYASASIEYNTFFLKPLYTTSLLAVNLSKQTRKNQLGGIKLNLVIRIRKKLNLAKFQLRLTTTYSGA